MPFKEGKRLHLLSVTEKPVLFKVKRQWTDANVTQRGMAGEKVTQHVTGK
jgi:hypothetical protein